MFNAFLIKKLGIYIIFNIILFFFFLSYGNLPLILGLISGLILLYKIGNKIYFLNNNYINFGSLIIISSIIFKSFGLLQLFIFKDSIETWPFIITDSINLNHEKRVLMILIGEWLSVIGTLIISTTWFLLGGLSLSLNINKNILNINGKKSYWAIYFLSFFIEFITRLNPSVNLYILNLCLYFSSLYSVIIICNLYKKDIKQHKFILTLFLCAPFIYNSFQTGMKEAMIVSLLPIIIHFFLKFNTFAQKIVLLCFSAVAFLIFSIFSNVTRLISWNNVRSVSFIELLNNFIKQFNNLNFDFILANIEQAVKRITPVFYQGWTVSLIYSNQTFESIYKNFFILLIPRFLWPSKPFNDPEREITQLFYGEEIAKSTSEAAGLYSEIFIKEGILIFFITCILIAFFIFYLQKISFQLKNTLFYGIFNFLLLFTTLRFHELYFTSIMPGLVIKYVYTLTFCLFINMIFKKNSYKYEL